MSNTYRLRPIESVEGIHAEPFPFNIWLPYVQLESERFVCEDTKEIWHRFSSATCYEESDEDPEGDLLEESESLPDGLVAWLGKKGTVPEVGDVFQVLDRKNQVIFEETISGTEKLYGKNYSTAQKTSEFAWETISRLGTEIKNLLDKDYQSSIGVDNSIRGASPKEPTYFEELTVSLRGIPFRLRVNEFATYLPFRRYSYETGQLGYKDIPAGHHWYQLQYYLEKDPQHMRTLGFGDGRAKDVFEKLCSVYPQARPKEPLNNRIQAASKRTGDHKAVAEEKTKTR